MSKKYHGLLSSRQEWYSLNCSYLVSKCSFISCRINSHLLVNEHKKHSNLFVLLSNIDKDRHISCLVTWGGRLLRNSPTPSVINNVESCHQSKAAALRVYQIEMLLKWEAQLQLTVLHCLSGWSSWYMCEKSNKHTLPLNYSAMFNYILRVKPLFSMCYIVSGIEVRWPNISSLKVITTYFFFFSSSILQRSPVFHYPLVPC